MSHGTSHAYIEHKCRCELCRANQNKKMRDLRRAKAYGRWEPKFVDANPARKHVLNLIAQGWGPAKIAEKAGLHLTTVRQLAYGRSPAEMTHSRSGRPQRLTRILKKNAEQLLALQYSVEASDKGSLVSPVGAHRRVEALLWQGYSMSWQAQKLGIPATNFSISLHRKKITAQRWHAIKNLYDTYVWTPRVATNANERSSITRAKRFALKNNFASPYYWNDIDTDIVKEKRTNK